MTVRQVSAQEDTEEESVARDGVPVSLSVSEDGESAAEEYGALEAFRRGDPAALERLYWDHVDYVERIVRRGLGSWRRYSGGSGPPRDSEDLVQDVFARAFSPAARRSYDGRREYRPYLAAITRNVLIDLFRAGRIDERLACERFPEGEAVVDELHAVEPRLLAIVKNYLARLSPELESVHHQRYVLGVSQEMTARALNLTRQRLRTLEGKLRAGLLRELKRAGIEVDE